LEHDRPLELEESTSAANEPQVARNRSTNRTSRFINPQLLNFDPEGEVFRIGARSTTRTSAIHLGPQAPQQPQLALERGSTAEAPARPAVTAPQTEQAIRRSPEIGRSAASTSHADTSHHLFHSRTRRDTHSTAFAGTLPLDTGWLVGPPESPPS